MSDAIEQEIQDNEITEEEVVVSDFAIIFDLERSAQNGREVVYKAVQEVLSCQGVEISEIEFSRYALLPSLELISENVINAFDIEGISPSKLTELLASIVKQRLLSSDCMIDENVVSLINAAKERNVIVAAVSGLDTNVAKELMAHWNLNEDEIELFCFDISDKSFLGADVWMSSAKSLQKEPRCCVALADSSNSCKAALSSGMRCIAVPDRFTSYQDFGGATMVLENPEDWNISEIIEQLFPSSDP